MTKPMNPEPADIPEEFKEGMEAIARGETLDLDEAMPELVSE
jgi:hypothetical protein